MIKKHILKISILLAILIITGCSDNPTAPGPQGQETITHETSGDPSPNKLMGYYTFSVNTESGDAEMVPMRGADLHLNLMPVFNTSMGIALALVPDESDIPNGVFAFDISITHPFPDKPELTGFDFTGIFMTPGSVPLGPFTFAGLDEIRVLNADGYTRWWNPSEFTKAGFLGYTEWVAANATPGELTATVNPYKYFADVLGPTDPMNALYAIPLNADGGRGMFSSGATNTRRYIFKFPMDPEPFVKYGFAVNASWDIPTVNPPLELPDDFPIEANQPEAFNIVMASKIENLYYDTETDTGGGVLRIQINVYDWQGWANENVVDEISQVRLFAPGLLATGVDAVLLDDLGNKARYIADLTGFAHPTATGDFLVMCKVVSSSGNYTQTGAPAPDGAVTAWQQMIVSAEEFNCEDDFNEEPYSIELQETIAGSVCFIEDLSDSYELSLPPGFEPSGEVTLISDKDGARLSLYTEDFNLLANAEVTDGSAVINLDELNYPASVIHFEVSTSIFDSPAYYWLHLDATSVDVTPTGLTEITPDNLYYWPRFSWIHEDVNYSIGDYGAWVYDIADPANPVKVGESISTPYVGAMLDADFIYPYAYFIMESNDGTNYFFGMVDFSDPVIPVYDYLVAPMFPEPLTSICMDSTHVFVGRDFNMVIAYDYTANPAAPSVVAQFQPLGVPLNMDILFRDTVDAKLAVDSDNKKITLYDLDDFPTMPPIGPSSGYLFDEIVDWVTHDEYIIILSRNAVPDKHYLYIFELVGNVVFDTGGWVDLDDHWMRDVDVNWPYIYVANGTDGLAVIDATDPTLPELLATTGFNEYAYDVAVEGNTVALTWRGGNMAYFDVTDPGAPVNLFEFDPINEPTAGFIHDSGDYLIVGDSQPPSLHGFVTLDITDPSNISVEDRRQAYSYLFIAQEEGVIVGTDDWDSMDFYDATDPLDITDIAWNDTGMSIGQSIIYGDYLYCGQFEEKDLHVFDISNKFSPNHEATLVTDHYIFNFHIYSHYLYAVTEFEVLIYDISDPTSPVYVGEGFTGNIRDSHLEGFNLFILRNNGINILSLVDPEVPTIIGGHNGVANDYDRFVIIGQFAYLSRSSYFTALYLYRIWPRDSIEYLDSFPAHGRSIGMFGHENIIYQITERAGLRIYEVY